jgi:flagellar biosynthesis anti-sigma factor FlgM
MRIDPSNPYLNQPVAEGPAKSAGDTTVSAQSARQAAAASGSSEPGDTVQLSGTLALAQQLKVQLAQVPDVRSARVAALQQQIQQGSYRPSSDQIANALLAEFSASGGQ